MVNISMVAVIYIITLIGLRPISNSLLVLRIALDCIFYIILYYIMYNIIILIMHYKYRVEYLLC